MLMFGLLNIFTFRPTEVNEISGKNLSVLQLRHPFR